MECYLGVPLEAGTGKQALIINEYKIGGKVENTRKIKIFIEEVNFTVEHVDFSSEKKKKIASPKNKFERMLIDNSLNTETPVKLWDGKFSLPVNGKITGNFGAIRKIGSKVLWRHKGVDISAKKGVSVLSSSSGRVILAREDFNLHGKTVILDHGLGVVSIYIHLNGLNVKEGQKVAEGDLIGYVGSTGLTTSSNLHWGVYVHSVPVNPIWWIQ